MRDPTPPETPADLSLQDIDARTGVENRAVENRAVENWAVERWALALDQPSAPTDAASAMPGDGTLERDRAIAQRIALLPRHAVPAGVWSTLAQAQARLNSAGHPGEGTKERATTRRWAAAAALAGVLCGASVRSLVDTEPEGGWPSLARMGAAPSIGTGSDVRLSEDLAIAYGLDND